MILGACFYLASVSCVSMPLSSCRPCPAATWGAWEEQPDRPVLRRRRTGTEGPRTAPLEGGQGQFTSQGASHAKHTKSEQYSLWAEMRYTISTLQGRNNILKSKIKSHVKIDISICNDDQRQTDKCSCRLLIKSLLWDLQSTDSVKNVIPDIHCLHRYWWGLVLFLPLVLLTASCGHIHTFNAHWHLEAALKSHSLTC